MEQIFYFYLKNLLLTITELLRILDLEEGFAKYEFVKLNLKIYIV